MFSLWDWHSVDPVAMSDDLDEILDVVQEGIDRNGPSDTETLALVFDEMPATPPVQIARSNELAQLAERGDAARLASRDLVRRIIADRATASA